MQAKLRQLFRFLAGAFLTLGLAQGAQAQGFMIPRPIPPRPQPPQPISIRSQKVDVQITNGAARVEVEQVFYNPNPFQVEGTYLFSLPQGATVSNFRMTVDKEPVEGKLLTVEEARRVYEGYVRRQIDPAILEYVGRNAFQARVFPIAPTSEKRIYLIYSQAADFNDGVYQINYPLNSERVTGSTAGDLVIDAKIKSTQAIKTIYSPTHEIRVARTDDHAARATFEGKDVRANRDFQLFYTISDKTFGLNALTHRRGDDGYVMLMLAPKREVARKDIQPKDVVFVFDTSGSMQGVKIEQARKALQTMLGALNEKDRFNVIRFASDVTQFKQELQPANKENIADAQKFVGEFRALSGTAIDDALQAGLAAFGPGVAGQERTPFLIFLTDGLPTIGVTDVSKILENAGKVARPGLRLFSFGVGADVNTLLLDRLALDHKGAADYVVQDDELENKVGTFYTKIADPVLANVKLETQGVTIKDMQPSRLPDLFAGTQLIVLGRYTGSGKGTITLTGDLNGKAQKYTYDLRLPEQEREQDFIPKLWANRQIGYLLEQIRLKGGDMPQNKELKDEVIRLSKEFGIVTPYTAYLVEEPGLQPLSSVRLGAEAAPGMAGGLGGGLAKRDGVARSRGAAVPGAAGARGPQGPAGSPGVPDNSPIVRERLEQQARFKQQADGYYRSTGANAVEASKRVRELKDQVQVIDEVESQRMIAGRQFQWQKGQWMDQTATPKMTRVDVKYGSDAYFQLLSENKDWAKYMAAGKQVLFRTGKSTVVQIGEKGKEKLTETELKALSK